MELEKFSRIELAPRPSTNAAWPGTNATFAASAPSQQVGRVDVIGERDPDEEPALGARPARLRGEVLCERVEHHVAPAAVEVAQRVDVRAPVAGAEVRGDEMLGQRGGAQVGRLLAEDQLGEDGARRDEPADPHPGREDLRHRARVHDEVGVASRAGGRLERAQRRQRVALVAQHPVGVVLEHDQLAFARSSTRRWRRGSDIVTPAGFWNVGIV